MLKKIIYSAIVLIILFFSFLFLSQGRVYAPDELIYGATFSKKQAENLNLNWQEAYLAMLDDLKIKNLRLPAYWNEIEAEKDKYNYNDLDWQIKEASQRGVNIIVAVGGRLPRWPECHWPEWAEKTNKEMRENEILEYIEYTIKKYKNIKEISAWQIENEPFLSHFGDCPKTDKKFLDKEIFLTRSLDSRPVIVTDSGELSLWVGAAKRADIFGTTMYKDTYSSHLKSYIHYPISPAFFKIKKNITSLFAQPKKWIVIELQAEPWCKIPFQNASPEERDRTMNLKKLKNMLEFARQTGFREFYLWGVEWWYWEKTTNNNPLLWEEIKLLINKT
jgi:hypothetical protein